MYIRHTTLEINFTNTVVAIDICFDTVTQMKPICIYFSPSSPAAGITYRMEQTCEFLGKLYETQTEGFLLGIPVHRILTKNVSRRFLNLTMSNGHSSSSRKQMVELRLDMKAVRLSFSYASELPTMRTRIARLVPNNLLAPSNVEKTITLSQLLYIVLNGTRT